jgi:hypothetical protein
MNQAPSGAAYFDLPQTISLLRSFNCFVVVFLQICRAYGAGFLDALPKCPVEIV